MSSIGHLRRTADGDEDGDEARVDAAQRLIVLISECLAASQVNHVKIGRRLFGLGEAVLYLLARRAALGLAPLEDELKEAVRARRVLVHQIGCRCACGHAALNGVSERAAAVDAFDPVAKQAAA
jgi:hypothetical protein